MAILVAALEVVVVEVQPAEPAERAAGSRADAQLLAESVAVLEHRDS